MKRLDYRIGEAILDGNLQRGCNHFLIVADVVSQQRKLGGQFGSDFNVQIQIAQKRLPTFGSVRIRRPLVEQGISETEVHVVFLAEFHLLYTCGYDVTSGNHLKSNIGRSKDYGINRTQSWLTM